MGWQLIYVPHLDTQDDVQSGPKIEDRAVAPPSTSVITASTGTITLDPVDPALEAAPAVDVNDSAEKKGEAPAALNEVLPSNDLEYAISRVTTHAKLLRTSITVHTASGIVRFRAAAQCILDSVQDTHRRYSWDVLRRRRDFRNTYVSALAEKLVTDKAAQAWSVPRPGADKILKRHELLEKEVPVIDKQFWTSLARWEYRKTVSVVHLCVVFFNVVEVCTMLLTHWISASNRFCDECDNLLFGVRHTCLECHGKFPRVSPFAGAASYLKPL